MKSKLEGIPRYSSSAASMPAQIFNEVRLGLLRLRGPLRFPLSGLRNLEMILDEETWICVDASLNDVPVLAWTDFADRHRTNLHEPVACLLHTYHAHAGVILEQVLESIDDNLNQRLHEDR